VPELPGWPATLRDGQVTLRPVRLRDGPAWSELRRRNEAWLREWEATPPAGGPSYPTSLSTFVAMTRRLRREARQARGMPFALLYEGELVGQLSVGGVTGGSLQSAHFGYWIDQRVAGRGIMPTAVALAVDHCFHVVGLHRIEVNIRPENQASRRVVEKLGFAEEGVRRRFLHIAGDWRDHVCYVLLREDLRGSLLTRWHMAQRTR
jgi:ribosomal-protein-alanine N-acetyltransferase